MLRRSSCFMSHTRYGSGSSSWNEWWMANLMPTYSNIIPCNSSCLITFAALQCKIVLFAGGSLKFSLDNWNILIDKQLGVS